MKSFYKIFLIVLISFLAQAAIAQKTFAQTFEIRLETVPQNQGVIDFISTQGIKEQTQIFVVPQQIISQTRANLSFQPIFVKNKTQNLDEYLAEIFRGRPRELRQDYHALGGFVVSQITAAPKSAAPRDAVWKEENGKVVEFSPDAWGQTFDILQVFQETANAIKHGQTFVNISSVKLPPSIRLSEINTFGVAELIAVGSSNFSGSSASRIKNIRVGASRYQGTVVPAGATFSFNDLLGPVDGAHGFEPELVIKHNGLVPEFGGGICQVSTTVFRAALNGGLPIVERRNHSFAVQYYAPQGTDATIYPGVQDLKFRNDTPGPILIWPEINGTILTFSFYGQRDGRQVQVNQPVRYNIRTTGAFSASVDRTVVYASGEEKVDTFRSNYRPKEEFTQTTTAAEPPATTPVPPIIPQEESEEI
jgi:vancomycin resistance protein YoaR